MMDSQDYLEINIVVASEEAAEIAEAYLMDLGFDSFMYKAPELKAYIQTPLFDRQAFDSTLEELSQVIDSGVVSFAPDGADGFTAPRKLSAVIVQLPAVNWNEKWEKTGFTPIVVGDVTVLPAGSEASTPVSIFLNPQMAFGTGHHDTTRMMISAMQDARGRLEGASVMDLGCGTAVLAILASKLGAGEVSAIDIDAVAVRSAQENVRMNGEDFSVVCGDALALQPGAYDVLLANIHKNIIIADMARYVEAMKAGGLLLVSGFYESDLPDVAATAERHGLRLAGEPLVSGGWVCVGFERA